MTKLKRGHEFEKEQRVGGTWQKTGKGEMIQISQKIKQFLRERNEGESVLSALYDSSVPCDLNELTTTILENL